MSHERGNVGRLLRWVVPLILLSILVYCCWPKPRGIVYSLYREYGKSKALAAVTLYQTYSTERFTVFYTAADQDVVDMIAETAEAVYRPVVEKLGYRPPGKVPIIIYPSREALRNAFGWGNGESAMGVYWSGTIRLLSPNVWIAEATGEQRRQVFRKLNPIAHELTHYVLDFYTNGNYPRWFTEGLAQRIEYQTTGYLWIEPESTLRQRLYSLTDLTTRFDELTNQPLAYRQAFLLVDYIACAYGEDGLYRLVQNLGKGVPFSRAVLLVTGDTVQQIHDDWLLWVQEHIDTLDPAS